VVTLQQAARSLADQLGGFGLFTVTEAAVGPDARRTLISSELVDEDRDPTSFNDYTLFAADGPLAGQQQAVRREGYDATNGLLYSSGLFSSVPQPGQVVEYHARLPRVRQFGEPGLREILNETLGLIWFEDQLPYASAASARVAAPAWLTSDRQIVGVLLGGSAGVTPAPSGITATLVHDATGAWLQLSSAPSGAFRVVARRPHRTWIKAGGSWGDSAAGLVDDEDETMADPQALLVVGAWRAYRALNRRSPDFEQGAWKAEEQRAEQQASLYLQFAIDTRTPLGSSGGSCGWAWAKGGSPGHGWY
jgi:hypothetical protein